MSPLPRLIFNVYHICFWEFHTLYHPHLFLEVVPDLTRSPLTQPYILIKKQSKTNSPSSISIRCILLGSPSGLSFYSWIINLLSKHFEISSSPSVLMPRLVVCCFTLCVFHGTGCGLWTLFIDRRSVLTLLLLAKQKVVDQSILFVDQWCCWVFAHFLDTPSPHL